jgi:hypothetical protein
MEMKKAMVCIIGVTFLIITLAFAADEPSSGTVKAVVEKSVRSKPAKMNARGKVVEISDQSIKIVRTVKGEAEMMEFILEKPAENIIINDLVHIAYMERDGKLMVSNVAKVVPKKAGKKETKPATEKSVLGNK